MAVINLLTGKYGPPRPRREVTPEPDRMEVMHEELTAAIGGIEAELARLTGEMETAKADVQTSRAAALSERARADELQRALTMNAAMHAQTMADLVGERMRTEGLRIQLANVPRETATPPDDGLRALLEAEREARIRLESRLDQAMRALASRPVPAPIAPPTYEMEVVGRDASGRAGKVLLKPRVT